MSFKDLSKFDVPDTAKSGGKQMAEEKAESNGKSNGKSTGKTPEKDAPAVESP